jgi:hypothetical protein
MDSLQRGFASFSAENRSSTNKLAATPITAATPKHPDAGFTVNLSGNWLFNFLSLLLHMGRTLRNLAAAVSIPKTRPRQIPAGVRNPQRNATVNWIIVKS